MRAPLERGAPGPVGTTLWQKQADSPKPAPASSKGRALIVIGTGHDSINDVKGATIFGTFGSLARLAVMERAGYGRKQLKEAAATFVDALVGDTGRS